LAPDPLPVVDGFSEDVLADNGEVELGEVAFLGVDGVVVAPVAAGADVVVAPVGAAAAGDVGAPDDVGDDAEGPVSVPGSAGSAGSVGSPSGVSGVSGLSVGSEGPESGISWGAFLTNLGWPLIVNCGLASPSSESPANTVWERQRGS
jgi:hypothetical protein